MVGDQFDQPDIKIIRINNIFQTIPNIHRSYDAIQYPLIFLRVKMTIKSILDNEILQKYVFWNVLLILINDPKDNDA